MPRNDWDAQAEFMRAHNATHATWSTNGDMLLSLTLAPLPAARVPGPAERMVDFHAQQEINAKRKHDILFAASTTKPKLVTPDPPPSVVPRAVRAKEEAARRGEATGR